MTSSVRLLAPLGLALLLAAAGVPAAELTHVDTGSSSLSFVFHEMGVPVDGHFHRYDVQLSFDPARPAAARAAIILDLASIDAGSDEANDEVVGKAWFNVREFPQARFVASSVKPLGNNRYELQGTLTIKGHSRELRAPVTYTPQGAAGQFDGQFTLQRADFAIGEGTWADFGTVANNIEIKFHFLASAGK